MREILFRGKDIAGNWHYGVPLIFTDDYVCMTAPHTYNKAVIPETVGQYTGLKDKNGKKIFEGDIVNVNTKRDETHSMYQGRHLIIRFDEYHRFVASGRLEYPLCNHYEWEITSNIYDNPELLKGGTDNGHP